MRLLAFAYRVVHDAFLKFLGDDGWAIASHIALSTLMSLFPFLIFITGLTSLLYGSEELAEKAAQILLEAWPEQVAGPIANELSNVLTRAQGGALTFGAVLALYFSTNGVESLRIGLNRAYNETEMRSWWLLRLESLVYVVVGAVSLSALSFLIVLAPLILPAVLRYLPGLAGVESLITFLRYAVTTTVLVLALITVHKWLPSGRRRLREIAPGIVVTLLLWLVSAVAFARYLATFSGAYVRTYAGLASAMVALVFLYWTAGIFVYGGELNQAIRRVKRNAAE
ncbi:MAG TPA: YihY/virulence factor BrkB family protein [Xanthobacteraceae bacterium]|nr:YihY/virulence factor BrkB family protein [Xanthobacteraceae bacterium]